MLKTYQQILLSFLVLMIPFFVPLKAESDFRYLPYLQNPDPQAMTILWFSESKEFGQLSYSEEDSENKITVLSKPVKDNSLAYSKWEGQTFFNNKAPALPYKHRIRLSNLQPATTYNYSVTQGKSKFSAMFKTSPVGNKPIRFIVYADSETEPESTGKFTRWDDPLSNRSRRYLIDQTQGYKNNLSVIKSRNPDLILIAGDLVQSGGEQRDWDEFWKHNTNEDGERSLAGKIPIIAALGNHEYYEGPHLDKYNQPGSERAVSKYLSYFEYPANNSPLKEQQDRYYSIKYGPVTFIVLDACNGHPNGSSSDSNYYLLGEKDSGGGFSPDFSKGSLQYQWLESELERAQIHSLFTFVMFHHAPYSSGPHGAPPGFGEQFDPQSGQATRLLTPVFMRYGVDAVFNGHDEIWERSTVSGAEVIDNQEANHTIHFYDVGTGGDGLRAPESGLENQQQKYIAHEDSPEVWQDRILQSGGKHYGHLEVDIVQDSEKSWQAVLKPTYVFPLMVDNGKTYKGFSRRMYGDQITLTKTVP